MFDEFCQLNHVSTSTEPNPPGNRCAIWNRRGTERTRKQVEEEMEWNGIGLTVTFHPLAFRTLLPQHFAR